MGEGNYKPNVEDYRMMYILYNRTHVDFLELAHVISNLMPDSFVTISKWRAHGYVVCRNDLVDVWLHDQDCHTAVVIAPRDEADDYDLAVRQMVELADKLFITLDKMNYSLFIRQSAWSSTRWRSQDV